MENKINKHNPPQKKPRNTPKTKQKKNGKNNPPPKTKHWESVQAAIFNLFSVSTKRVRDIPEFADVLIVCFSLSSLQSLTKFTK